MLISADCYSWNDGCGWSLQSLWRDWDWFSRAAVSLLALMAANSLIIFGERLYRYRVAHTQGSIFLQAVGAALRDGRFDEVMSIVTRTPQSPTASIMAEGIRAFASSPAQFTDRQAVDAVERACRRVHAVLNAELARGLGTLKTIALLAPFVGLLGTCFGILNAFRGVGMQKAAAMAMVASFIAEALVVTATGLLVGIIAVWLHNYLWRRVEVFGSEMLEAETNLLDALKAHPSWRRDQQLPSALKTKWALLMAEAPAWEVSYDEQRLLLLTMWSCWVWLLMLLLRAC